MKKVYRLLVEGEIMEEDDECFIPGCKAEGRWEKTNPLNIGQPWEEEIYWPMRRLLPDFNTDQLNDGH
jgi:hypothetical protein